MRVSVPTIALLAVVSLFAYFVLHAPTGSPKEPPNESEAPLEAISPEQIGSFIVQGEDFYGYLDSTGRLAGFRTMNDRLEYFEGAIEPIHAKATLRELVSTAVADGHIVPLHYYSKSGPAPNAPMKPGYYPYFLDSSKRLRAVLEPLMENLPTKSLEPNQSILLYLPRRAPENERELYQGWTYLAGGFIPDWSELPNAERTKAYREWVRRQIPGYPWLVLSDKPNEALVSSLQLEDFLSKLPVPESIGKRVLLSEGTAKVEQESSPVPVLESETAVFPQANLCASYPIQGLLVQGSQKLAFYSPDLKTLHLVSNSRGSVERRSTPFTDELIVAIIGHTPDPERRRYQSQWGGKLYLPQFWGSGQQGYQRNTYFTGNTPQDLPLYLDSKETAELLDLLSSSPSGPDEFEGPEVNWAIDSPRSIVGDRQGYLQ